ncbi:hypothetical protein [Neptuniibacter halophilus]|uniref:hypothetical protein n=1 Tax=Neptuniibacter halophilus TaxID=651666 RepID=UPI0025729421|nr:hypothetical protein [Neptuniibacter halophilus]
MQVYLVGGAVRDTLLDYPVYDKDWVVVGATPEQMIEQGYQPVGQDFPVFIHPETGEEYALARTERKSGKGYTGFSYHASPDVTLEQDLQRRDLTINAMAMDQQGTLFDPYQGQQDLQDKYLRHVSPAFAEDPLRVLRVARFAARYAHLGFRVADETMALMQQLSASDELEHLTTERVWKECERALGEGSPEVFFQRLLECGAIRKVFPELEAALKQPQTLTDFRHCCQQIDLPSARFACLVTLCDLNDSNAFCDRIRTPRAYKELAQQCLQQHSNLSRFDLLSAGQKYDTLKQLDLIRRPQRLDHLLACIRALHQETRCTTLQPILEQISHISPQALLKRGFKGAGLGAEIDRLRIEICQQHS